MKNPRFPVLLSAILGGALLAPARAQVPPARSPAPETLLENARQLQAAGDDRAAFWQLLAIAGGEEAAADIARPQAQTFLDELKTPPDNIAPARVALLRGEMQLALGQKVEALESFRRAAQQWPQLPDKSQIYPVETPDARNNNFSRSRLALAAPLTVGPGSHRDNWLVRRFIALEAWDDAARELERIWQIHRQFARPYRFETLVFNPETKTSELAILQTQPNGFDGLGLQFAVDYAYFLKRRGQSDVALAVLREPFDIMEVGGAPPAATPTTNSDLPLLWRRDFGFFRFGMNSARTAPVARLSPAEFARLAWGEWKDAGRGDELIASLNAQIAGGDNRARRVLALVERHRGQLDSARDLELAWIDNGEFSPFASALQRGIIEAEFGKTREAARAYEAALQLPFSGDAVLRATPMWGTMELGMTRTQKAMEAQERVAIRENLIRLYGALDNTPRILELTLENLEAQPLRRQNLLVLEETQKRFATAQQSARWNAWVQTHLIESADLQGRANGFWLRGNRGAVLQVLEALARNAKTAPGVDEWQRRFEQAGLKLEFLGAMARAQPQEARWQLELLRARGQTSGAHEIRALELLLETGNTGFGKGNRRDYERRGPFLIVGEKSERANNDGTHFKDPFELALRLMTLYDRAGQSTPLQALALRIARGTEPFKLENWNNGFSDNGAAESGNAALALAIARADANGRAQLEESLKNSPWQGARAQLRRLKSGLKPENSAPFGWSGDVAAVQGARVLASVNNVLALCRDDKYLYSGHPWGVAVYDLSGKPVTRVALGAPALQLARVGGALFVGNAQGLWRIGVGDWRVGIVDFLDAKSREDDLASNVTALAVQNGKVWLATRRDVRLFDPRTREMRVWNAETLGFDGHFTVNRFVFDGEWVWADADEGCRRFDSKSNSWRAPQMPDSRTDAREPIQFVDIINGQTWADVTVDDERRHRPALVDAKTLEVRPIPLFGEKRDGDQNRWLVNAEFSCYGDWNGQSVWGAGWPRWSFDEATQRLKPLPTDAQNGDLLPSVRANIKNEWPRIGLSGQWRRRFDGALICPETENAKLGERAIVTSFWTALALPQSALALGAGFSDPRDYRHRYGNGLNGESGEWSATQFPRELPLDSGGLWLSSGAQTRAISAAPRADTLSADLVFDAVFDANRQTVWLATERGLAGVRAGENFANLTRADGLLSNRVTSAARAAGGRLFFAARWDDDGGGLMMLDPQTLLVRSFLDVGGLPNNALERVAATPSGRVDLTFGWQYRRWSDFKNQRQPNGWFDPKTGAFSAPLAPVVSKDAKLSAPKSLGTLPILGGPMTGRQQFAGRTWLLGTRGVVIVGDKAIAPAKFARIAVKVAPDPRELQLADAKKRDPKISSLAQLQSAMKDSNPLFRAESLSSLLGNSLLNQAPVRAVLVERLDDSNVRARATALALLNNLPANLELSEAEKSAQIAAFKRHLNDDDATVRSWSIFSLLKAGEVPAPALLRRQLAARGSSGLPFGAESTIGLASKDAFYEALAPLADAEVFAILLENPPAPDNDFERKIFPALGQSLLRHPGAAPVLLRAYDAKAYEKSKRDFAQSVFKNAGKKSLPLLLAALQSDDRVVRSNAARALGALGDASAIAPLIDALDLESGLSRASIVWALGELKATTALDKLASLYTELENAPRGSGGFLAQQSFALNQSQYAAINARAEGEAAFAALKTVDDVADDYATIGAPKTPIDPIDPRRDEELLSSQMILQAVGKIGPAAMGDWYRKLAASSNAGARQQAAIHLSDKPILRNLLADSADIVRLSAAVSLLELGEISGQKEILDAFSNRALGTTAILEELRRVSDAKKLAFARAQLMALADDTNLSDAQRRKVRALLAN